MQQLIILRGVQGSGKAQPLTSNVLTPAGWRPMGSLRIGDRVITQSGYATTVTGVFPQGTTDVYAVKFHDGASTKCSGDHLWRVYVPKSYSDRRSVAKVMTTRELIEYRNTHKFNVSIDLVGPVQFDQDDPLPLDPYLLGVLIGDGSIVRGARITSADEEIVNSVRRTLRDDYQLVRLGNTKIEYSIVQRHPVRLGGRRGMSPNWYSDQLKLLDLYGKRSYEKAIPGLYMRAPTEARLQLLRGLLDTDGTVGKKGSITYYTSSAQLASDVQQLVWSLGGTCSIKDRVRHYTYNGVRKAGRRSYSLHIAHPSPRTLVSLSRKINRCNDAFAHGHNRGEVSLRRRIVSISREHDEETQCISVDDPSALYVTDDFIVTHNTTFARTLCDSIPNTCMFAADDYFEKDGTYRFDPSKLGVAHAECLSNTEQALRAGRSVIVHNTFSSTRELRPYLTLAESLGVRATVLVVENHHGNKDVHSVPQDVRENVAKRLHNSIKLI